MALNSPWWMGIFPWAVLALSQWACPSLAAPLAAAAFVIVTKRAKIRWNALDQGVFAYFIILSVIGLAGSGHMLPINARLALCPAMLAIAAGGSVMRRRPFTFAYACQYAPAGIQAQPAFYLANQIITLVWAAGFALASALLIFNGKNALVSPMVILAGVLGTTAVASILIGGWFHFWRLRPTMP